MHTGSFILTINDNLILQNDNGIEQQIVNAENRNLSHFLEKYNLSRPIFVEGPQIVWLRKNRIHYYLLKADVNPNHSDEGNSNTLSPPPPKVSKSYIDEGKLPF